MIQFSIGLSALQAAQQGLAIAGNNLANASTPGYHRQSVTLATQSSTEMQGLSYGNGVYISDVNRIVNEHLDAALAQQTSVNGYVDTSLSTSTQIQQTLSPGISSPTDQLNSLLNNLQQLSTNPSDAASRQAAITSAKAVATAFNTASSSLSQIKGGLDVDISTVVEQVNSLTKQIADLNSQISSATNSGASPNTLLDQRGQLVNNLSQLVGIQVQNGTNSQIAVIVGGAVVVGGVQANALTTGVDSSGNTTISVKGTDTSLSIDGGQLGAYLSQRNNTITDFQNRLDTLAKQIASSFNAVQSTGLGSSGGLTHLAGQNGVSSTTVPLTAAGLDFPPKAGSLFLGVTDVSTGIRTVTEIPIDPQTQSLQDVANAIGTAAPNLSTFVNSQNGTLSLTADTGYTFDFAGGYNTHPTAAFSGTTTTTPTIGGTVTGNINDNYQFTFTSSGTVGVTPGLQAQVTDSSGSVVGTFNVGQGYQTGQPITVANGLTFSLSPGAVTNTDSFSTPISGNPDSAGLLNALGLNTLFSGNSASSLSVSAQISSDPNQLSTSRTGQPGDSSNLVRFAALGTAGVLNSGTQTFAQYSSGIISDIGAQVQSLTSQQASNQTLTTSLTNQQQSLSGVDTNEELAKVLQFQQMFQLAGKYISAVNDTLQQLLTIVN